MARVAMHAKSAKPRITTPSGNHGNSGDVARGLGCSCWHVFSKQACPKRWVRAKLPPSAVSPCIVVARVCVWACQDLSGFVWICQDLPGLVRTCQDLRGHAVHRFARGASGRVETRYVSSCRALRWESPAAPGRIVRRSVLSQGFHCGCPKGANELSEVVRYFARRRHALLSAVVCRIVLSRVCQSLAGRARDANRSRVFCVFVLEVSCALSRGGESGVVDTRRELSAVLRLARSFASERQESTGGVGRCGAFSLVFARVRARTRNKLSRWFARNQQGC
jgi:hypothetical protein